MHYEGQEIRPTLRYQKHYEKKRNPVWYQCIKIFPSLKNEMRQFF